MATTSLPADFPVLWTKIWLKNIRILSFHWFIPWNSIKSHQNIIKPQWNHQTPIKIPLKTTGFYLIWPRLPCGAAASKATSGTDAVEAPRTAALTSSSAFASRPSLLRISSSASFCNGDPIVLRYHEIPISYNDIRIFMCDRGLLNMYIYIYIYIHIHCEESQMVVTCPLWTSININTASISQIDTLW